MILHKYGIAIPLGSRVFEVANWWLQEGCKRYPAARELFIIADGGEATVHAAVPRRKLFKTHLFSQISRNWAGEPLTDIDKALNLIRTTRRKPASSSPPN